MVELPVKLPSSATPKASVNQKVSKGDVIATVEKKDLVVEAAEILGVESSKVFQYLKKNLGDKVKKDEIVAEKKAMLGGGKKVLSPADGTVSRIEESTGRVHIYPDEAGDGQDDIISPVDGEIKAFDKDKIIISTTKNALPAAKAIGQEAQGEAVFIADTDYTRINSTVAGKIAVGEKFEKEAVMKAFGLGAVGIVCKDMQDFDFSYMRDKAFPQPLIVVGDKEFKAIKEAEGKTLYLNGKDKFVIII